MPTPTRFLLACRVNQMSESFWDGGRFQSFPGPDETTTRHEFHAELRCRSDDQNRLSPPPNTHVDHKDIADIDALGSTLPYCDIVVTDKAPGVTCGAALNLASGTARITSRRRRPRAIP